MISSNIWGYKYSTQPPQTQPSELPQSLNDKIEEFVKSWNLQLDSSTKKTLQHTFFDLTEEILNLNLTNIIEAEKIHHLTVLAVSLKILKPTYLPAKQLKIFCGLTRYFLAIEHKTEAIQWALKIPSLEFSDSNDPLHADDYKRVILTAKEYYAKTSDPLTMYAILSAIKKCPDQEASCYFSLLRTIRNALEISDNQSIPHHIWDNRDKLTITSLKLIKIDFYFFIINLAKSYFPKKLPDLASNLLEVKKEFCPDKDTKNLDQLSDEEKARYEAFYKASYQANFPLYKKFLNKLIDEVQSINIDGKFMEFSSEQCQLIINSIDIPPLKPQFLKNGLPIRRSNQQPNRRSPSSKPLSLFSSNSDPIIAQKKFTLN